MSWNLFEKIINAFKPAKQPEQEQYEQEYGESEPWSETDTQQPEASQEPSPDHEQQPVNTTEQNDWQD